MGIENTDLTPDKQEEDLSTDIESQPSITESSEALRQTTIEAKKTILHMAYLATTVSRLESNRDLDELFDGEVQLGEEEMLAIYSLIEIINGSNKIAALRAPKTMNLDWNWAQDYDYRISYEDKYIKNGKILDHKGVKSLSDEEKNKFRVKFLSKIIGDGRALLNETDLVFNYNDQMDIESIDFARPFNLNVYAGPISTLGIDQTINIERNKDNLVEYLEINRPDGINNKIRISYDQGRLSEIKQAKIGPDSIADKTNFGYNENGSLALIAYNPGLSLKHVKGAQRAHKRGGIRFLGEYVTTTAMKQMKGLDIVEMKTNNEGLPIATNSELDASEWFYNNGFSTVKYEKTGEPSQIHMEKEEIGPDDIKTIDIKY